MSTFETLNSINVNEHVEKKNGLSYLSWAWAWAELKKRFPDATYTIYEDENGCFYHTDGRTAWVKTGVTVEGIEHIEYLPIMNFKNQSIPLDSLTSFDVNKAVQRSLTKAVARHGLGLYIYAGEDLPEDGEEVHDEPADGITLAALNTFMEEHGMEIEKTLAWFNKKCDTNYPNFGAFTRNQILNGMQALEKAMAAKKK